MVAGEKNMGDVRVNAVDTIDDGFLRSRPCDAGAHSARAPYGLRPRKKVDHLPLILDDHRRIPPPVCRAAANTLGHSAGPCEGRSPDARNAAAPRRPRFEALLATIKSPLGPFSGARGCSFADCLRRGDMDGGFRRLESDNRSGITSGQISSL